MVLYCLWWLIMGDLRLKKRAFTVAGKEYNLVCNMNVLADVQELSGGMLGSVLDSASSVRTSLLFAAAMVNECADINGWPERYTARELGRIIPASKLSELVETVNFLLFSAFGAEEQTETSEPTEEDSKKN